MSLGYHVCISAGAMVVGNIRWAKQFFEKADKIAERLLQDTRACQDYSLALSLVGLVFLLDCLDLPLRFVNNKDNYLSAVHRICRQRSAFIHSDAFLRYFYFRAISKGHSFEEAQTMKEMINIVSSLPTFSIIESSIEQFVCIPTSEMEDMDVLAQSFATRVASLQQSVSPTALKHLSAFTSGM